MCIPKSEAKVPMATRRSICSSRTGGEQERRKSERYRVSSSGTVYWVDDRHLGVVRDVSYDGLFVFSHFIPAIGEQIRVVIVRSPLHNLCVEGSVIRVELECACGTTGIAISITSCEPKLQPDDLVLSR